MKKIFFLLLSVSSMGHAADFAIAEMKFQLQVENVEEKLITILRSPQGVLKRYKPAGMVVNKKVVTGNNVFINATKTKMFLSKTVNIKGQLNYDQSLANCRSGEVGHTVSFDLHGSDALLYDSVDSVNAVICIKERSLNHTDLRIISFIRQGDNFNNVYGDILLRMISNQSQPIFKALIEEVKDI